jgi:hypothetical protein
MAELTFAHSKNYQQQVGEEGEAFAARTERLLYEFDKDYKEQGPIALVRYNFMQRPLLIRVNNYMADIITRRPVIQAKLIKDINEYYAPDLTDSAGGTEKVTVFGQDFYHYRKKRYFETVVENEIQRVRSCLCMLCQDTFWLRVLYPAKKAYIDNDGIAMQCPVCVTPRREQEKPKYKRRLIGGDGEN